MGGCPVAGTCKGPAEITTAAVRLPLAAPATWRLRSPKILPRRCLFSTEAWCFIGCSGTTRLLWSIRCDPEGVIPSERVEIAGEGRAENTGETFVDGVGETARVDMEAGLLLFGGTKQRPFAISRGTPSVLAGLCCLPNQAGLIRAVAGLEGLWLRLRQGREELQSASSSPASYRPSS